MIPETTTIEQDDDVLVWRNDDFMISMDQAEAIAAEIERHLNEGTIAGLLVDNREAEGTWPQEANEVWSELMGTIYDREIRCATVSPSVTNSMQINRLSRQAGTDDRIKAFPSRDYGEAVEFIE